MCQPPPWPAPQGGLPARWASKGFFVNLFTLNLRNNNGLYGSVPPSWGQTSASWPATCAINIGSTGIKGGVGRGVGRQAGCLAGLRAPPCLAQQEPRPAAHHLCAHSS